MTPIAWDGTTEPLCGEHDPLGRDDTANKYLRTVWQAFRVGHAANGTHRRDIGGLPLALFEEGAYVGNAAPRVIALTQPTLLIRLILIVADAASHPVARLADMPNSKAFDIAAYQAAMITEIATPGQFALGANAAVNAANVNYYWSVVGTPAT